MRDEWRFKKKDFKQQNNEQLVMNQERTIVFKIKRSIEIQDPVNCS